MNRFKHLLDSFTALKRLAIFALVVLVAITLYLILVNYTFVGRNMTFSIVAIWILAAYLVLPRLHRILTKIYLPDYYIGRSRTSDGILGDPINLSVIGSSKQLKAAMKAAGWIMADELSTRTVLKLVRATILHESYPSAPVSSLYLFNRKQTFTFQKEIGGSIARRHHVRFWKTPRDWLLPGGFDCDWVGAATYDKSVGLSLFTFQVTHKIDADIDVERDYVVDSVLNDNKNAGVKVIQNFSTGYHSKNGGGDYINTNGDMPFINLS